MKTKVITAIVLLSTLLCSCGKEGTALFKGNYSFKTSGTISARQISDPADPDLPSDLTIKITTESGQMDITPQGGDAMVVTMNVTGGDMIVYNARVDGEDIIISQDVRNVMLPFPSGEESDKHLSTVRADVTVSGTGHRYDNIILFRFTCSGVFKVKDTEYEIYSSDIDCRAKLNE